jgi:hypothetical protein
MGEEVIYLGTQYKLRAGAPMSTESGDFILHTFMAEKIEFDIVAYTKELKGSDDFRGQGGEFISGSYSRLQDSSGNAFSGKLERSPEYIDEDEMVESGG